EQRDAGVVGWIAARRGLEHAVPVYGDAVLLEAGGDPLDLGTEEVAGHGLAVAGQLFRVHFPHPGAGPQALGGQLDIAGTADDHADVGLVRGLVLAEPDVPVRPEDLR